MWFRENILPTHHTFWVVCILIIHTRYILAIHNLNILAVHDMYIVAIHNMYILAIHSTSELYITHNMGCVYQGGQTVASVWLIIMGLFASIVAVEREKIERFLGLLPESEGQHMALTVLHVRCVLDSGFTFGCRECLGAPRVVDGHGVDAHHQHCVATEGPMRGHPRCGLGAVGAVLEPFCGHLSPKIDKVY